MAGVSVIHKPLSPTHCTYPATPFKFCAPPRVGVVIAVKYILSKKNIVVVVGDVGVEFLPIQTNTWKITT